MIPFAHYEEAAAYIRARSPVQPELCLVLGSGLGRLADEVEGAVSLPYEDIPHFPAATAHRGGRLVLGRLAGRPAAVMAGPLPLLRRPLDGGVAFYVRVMGAARGEVPAADNAAGGWPSPLRGRGFPAHHRPHQVFHRQPLPRGDPRRLRCPLFRYEPGVYPSPPRDGGGVRAGTWHNLAPRRIFLYGGPAVRDSGRDPRHPPSRRGRGGHVHRARRPSPPLSAGWRCWASPASPTWPPDCCRTPW